MVFFKNRFLLAVVAIVSFACASIDIYAAQNGKKKRKRKRGDGKTILSSSLKKQKADEKDEKADVLQNETAVSQAGTINPEVQSEGIAPDQSIVPAVINPVQRPVSVLGGLDEEEKETLVNQHFDRKHVENKQIMSLDCDGVNVDLEEKELKIPSDEEIKQVFEEITSCIIASDNNIPQSIQTALDSVDKTSEGLDQILLDEKKPYKKALIDQPSKGISTALAYLLTSHSLFFWTKKLCTNVLSLPSLISDFPSFNMISIPLNIAFFSLVLAEALFAKRVRNGSSRLATVFDDQVRDISNFIFKPSRTVGLDEISQVAYQYGVGDGVDALNTANMTPDFVRAFTKRAFFNLALKFFKITVNLSLPLATLSGAPYLHSLYLCGIFLPAVSYLYVMPLVAYYRGAQDLSVARDQVISAFARNLKEIQHQIVRFVEENQALGGVASVVHENALTLLNSLSECQSRTQQLIDLPAQEEKALSYNEILSKNRLEGASELIQEEQEKINTRILHDKTFLNKSINQIYGKAKRFIWHSMKLIHKAFSACKRRTA